MTWKRPAHAAVGRDFAVVESEISIEGRSSGINVVAHGGWLVRFEGELVAEGVLHQNFEEALARGDGGAPWRRPASTSSARRSPTGADPGRCSRRRSPAAST